MTLVVKNPPAGSGDVGDSGSILGWDDPLEEGMATHSSFLAWRILWTRVTWFTWDTNKIPRQGICTIYIGPPAPLEYRKVPLLGLLLAWA